MKLRIIQQERNFMNSRINIKVFSDKSREEIESKLEEAFSKFRYVVDKFTRFDEKSELSRLNNSTGEFKVSQELFELVQFAIKLAKETEGAFDPTIIDLLEAYGYKRKYDFSILNNPNLLKKEIAVITKERASFKDIKLNRKKLTIKLKPKQKVDLGSIGKGYAMDLAVEVLKPLKNFLINAGGDIFAHGVNKKNKPWKAGLLLVDEKGKTKVIGKVELKNQALASSGSWARKVSYFHHLLNPKTGKPIDNVLQTFVIADTAMIADAYSTVLFTIGKNGLKLLEEKGVEGLILTKGEKKYMTNEMKFQQ